MPRRCDRDHKSSVFGPGYIQAFAGGLSLLLPIIAPVCRHEMFSGVQREQVADAEEIVEAPSPRQAMPCRCGDDAGGGLGCDFGGDDDRWLRVW